MDFKEISVLGSCIIDRDIFAKSASKQFFFFFQIPTANVYLQKIFFENSDSKYIKNIEHCNSYSRYTTSYDFFFLLGS